jgi:hypothetical protein
MTWPSLGRQFRLRQLRDRARRDKVYLVGSRDNDSPHLIIRAKSGVKAVRIGERIITNCTLDVLNRLN